MASAALAEPAPIAATDAGRISVERFGKFTATYEMNPARSSFDCGHSEGRLLIRGVQETSQQVEPRGRHCADAIAGQERGSE